MTRRFSPRCSECRKKTMAIATIPYDIHVEHDGKEYDVHIANLSVPRCTECGSISLDQTASETIDEAFRREAGLLTPYDIRQGRINAGFPQQADFAKCLGIGVSTLSRWETGSQVQQHFHDGVLRAFFAIKGLREFLSHLHHAEPVSDGATEA